ncbi:unnamed protein product [Rhizophagus irregularis]|uniref:Uncharacterized protein n=1 Tax=Rhizophagus irregularis TaxID=588596 RepID=A0A916E339_9GLOM|nr:unnamed protein product [Rhizophagus irregularis]CAB4485572.1 unnamed protein product [Rhizophagus irregularis]CAB5356727.1 unnamed protein product [Rhizophagus irregularis]
MEYTVELNYFLILTTIMIVASTHNFIKSIVFYRGDYLKFSSILKITFNISGLLCALSNIGLLITINTTSLSQFWKLRQFIKSKLDNYIVYGLLLIRSLFYIISIAFIQPQITFNITSPNVTSCDNDAHQEKWFLITTIADLSIDVYVTFRIIQCILGYSTTNQRSHSPYTSIVVNSLPILIASLYHINTFIFKLSIPGYMFKTVTFVILSYVITFIIDLPHLSESDLEKRNFEQGVVQPSIPDEDIVLRTSNGMLVDMPLNNVRDEIKMEQQYKVEKLEPDSDVGFLKQSLSFYEVISVLFGNDKDDKKQSS